MMGTFELWPTINGVILKDDSGSVKLVLLVKPGEGRTTELVDLYPGLPVQEAIQAKWYE